MSYAMISEEIKRGQKRDERIETLEKRIEELEKAIKDKDCEECDAYAAWCLSQKALEGGSEKHS